MEACKQSAIMVDKTKKKENPHLNLGGGFPFLISKLFHYLNFMMKKTVIFKKME